MAPAEALPAPARQPSDRQGGRAAGAPTTDQRGTARRVGAAPDIGAFESQGFAFANPTGTPQSTASARQFTTPLALTVVANNPPRARRWRSGHLHRHTRLAAHQRASPTSPAAISGGKASVTATANDAGGRTVLVTPSANGVGGAATFALTNTRGPVTSIVLTRTGGAAVLTLKVGETAQLTATATYADHSTQVLPAVQLVWQWGQRKGDGGCERQRDGAERRGAGDGDGDAGRSDGADRGDGGDADAHRGAAGPRAREQAGRGERADGRIADPRAATERTGTGRGWPGAESKPNRAVIAGNTWNAYCRRQNRSVSACLPAAH